MSSRVECENVFCTRDASRMVGNLYLCNRCADLQEAKVKRAQTLLDQAEKSEKGVDLQCKHCGSQNSIQSDADLSHCWQCGEDLDDSI